VAKGTEYLGALLSARSLLHTRLTKALQMHASSDAAPGSLLEGRKLPTHQCSQENSVCLFLFRNRVSWNWSKFHGWSLLAEYARFILTIDRSDAT
jgi:hypothetical protein